MLRSTVVALGLATVASAALGQGCVIDVDKPALLYGAKIAITKLSDDGDQAHANEKPKHLRNTLDILYEQTGKIDNQIGRYYLLGRTYSVWLRLETKGWPTIIERSRLGFVKDPKGMHDMFAAMDTAFAKVEALNPACSDSTGRHRATVANIVYNAANQMLTAKQYDSAIVYARRALVANPKGAGPWNVIAAAMQGRGDTAGYKDALRRVAESTEQGMQKVRGQAYYNLAVLTLTAAAKKEGEEKKAMAAEAEKDLREFLKLKDGDPAGQAALSQALTMKGDTVEARRMMQDMLAHPEKFTALTLFAAAGSSHAAQQYDDALKLYQAGLVKNPLFRDALFSLASTYVTATKYDEAVPVSAKLLAVDPNNVNTYTQAWNVWRGVNRNSTNAALKAIAGDSALHYGTLRTDAPVSVEMSPEFDTANDSASIEGVVQNRSAATKSYQITFEFLNATGGVVTSATVPVADVPAKTGKRFSVAVAGKGIVSWRYKKLD